MPPTPSDPESVRFGDFVLHLRSGELTQNGVKRLREALGDSATSPRLIETLPRRGYRFIAAIEEKEQTAEKDDNAENGAPPTSAPVAPQPSVRAAARPRRLATIGVLMLACLASWRCQATHLWNRGRA